MKFMRLALLPALTLTIPAMAEESLAELQRRCAEQEREIVKLELEVERLRGLLEGEVNSAEPAVANATPEVSEPAAAEANFHTVKAGESLTRIARQHDTTPDVIAKLNGIDNPSLIRVGQKLKLPAPPVAEPVVEETAQTEPEVPIQEPEVEAEEPRFHIVKSGETFFSIARSYEVSVSDLSEVNPGVNPRNLQVGQKLHLTGNAKGNAQPATSEIPAETATVTSSTPKPIYRRVKVDENISFGEFARKHGMDPRRLNALNGLHLDPSTPLATGSVLYVSAQPLD